MIGIIAGAGSLPVFAAQKLAREQKPFCIFSLTPEDNAALFTGGTVIPVDVFKVGHILDLLAQHHISQVLFAGKVEKKKLLANAQLDWLGIKLLASVATKSDMAIMEVIIKTLADHGISVISQKDLFGELQLPAGLQLGSLSPEEHGDVTMGMQTARALANANVGQTVVVKQGIIVAVEALEGTTACIERAYQLAGMGLIICKAARDSHNPAYDLPTLGPATLQHLPADAIKVIAWESQHTLIADQERFISLAARRNIALITL